MKRLHFSVLPPWKQPFASEVIALSWPLCVSLLSYSVMTLVDTLFVGNLGMAPLAAMGLAGVVSFTVLSFGLGMFRAGKIAISQAVGANQQGQIPGLVGAFLVLVLGLGLASMLLGQAAAWILPSLTPDPEVGRFARQYTCLRTLGAPISLSAIALAQARIAVGDSRAPMRASLLANLANIPLNAFLIYGLNWGIAGAAIGSGLAQLLQVVVLCQAQKVDGFGLRQWRRRDIATVWHFGLPGGLEVLFDSGAFVALMIVLAQMPTKQLAAHQIALQISHFSFLPMHAIAEAASVMTARAVGSARDQDVPACCRTARSLSLLVAAGTAFVIVLLRKQICEPFTEDSEVVAVACQLLIIFVPPILANAYYSSYRGGLRGTGDVRFTTRVTVLCAWLITPPLAYYWGLYWNWGALGTWLALNVEIMLGALWMTWRLSASGWLRAAVSSRRRLSSPAG